MGTFRRIVTGHSADGRSVIASDRRVEFDAIPGLGGIVLGTLWGSDAAPSIPTSAASRRIRPGSRRSAACGSSSSCCRRRLPEQSRAAAVRAGTGRRREARSRAADDFDDRRSRYAPLGDDRHAVRDLRPLRARARRRLEDRDQRRRCRRAERHDAPLAQPLRRAVPRARRARRSALDEVSAAGTARKRRNVETTRFLRVRRAPPEGE